MKTTALCVLVALSGCADVRPPHVPDEALFVPSPEEPDEPMPEQPEEEARPDVDELAMFDATFRGEVGPIGPFDVDVTEVQSTMSLGTWVLRLDAHPDETWAMIELSMPHADLRRGTREVVTPLSATGLGCSGWNRATPVFDRRLEDIAVRIEPGPDPDSALVQMTGTFIRHQTWGAQSVEASILVLF